MIMSDDNRLIQFKDFGIGFGSRRLLSDVNTSMCGSTLTALIGRNGTGKSTLLRAIAGLNTNYQGVIEVCGRDLHKASPALVARSLSFVSTGRQRIAAMRCRDIVAMGRAPYTNWIGRLSAADNEAVDTALADVGMAEYGMRDIDTLSDGEYQRIMIARALAQDTPVLLLDEPTSFLDIPNRYALCKLLADLAHRRNKCVLFSTHELDIAVKLADALALINPPHLENGLVQAITESGVIERLFACPV